MKTAIFFFFLREIASASQRYLWFPNQLKYLWNTSQTLSFLENSLKKGVDFQIPFDAVNCRKFSLPPVKLTYIGLEKVSVPCLEKSSLNSKEKLVFTIHKLKGIKGQIISKGLLVSSNSPKSNQRIRFYYYYEFVSSFYWENSRTPKGPFEIICMY